MMDGKLPQAPSCLMEALSFIIIAECFLMKCRIPNILVVSEHSMYVYVAADSAIVDVLFW